MKRYLIVALTLILCVGFVACSHIEDTNGETETGLATLTNTELTAKAPSYTTTVSVRSEVNGQSTLKVKKFSGVDRLDSVRVKEGAASVNFTVSTTLTSGNLYVYVYKDGKILGDLSLCKGATLKLESPAAGEYELRIAGESAEFTVSYSIDVK